MENWMFLLVGVVAGMNLGYMLGLHRGAEIVGELISGLMDSLFGLASKGEERGA